MSKRWRIMRSVAAHPRVLAAGPALGLFLLGYLRKFRIREVGGNLIIHSHLPPLNSAAYGRFVAEHLARGHDGPSHAQVAITSSCPQRCGYCYNRERAGIPLTKAEILDTIDGLAGMGVFWLGITGGEPLVNPDLPEIVAHAARRCAVKLFTSGSTLTPELALELRRAGLFSVCVSLDHWREEVHDAGRNYPGAYQAALQAVRSFLDAGLDTGVSAVLSRSMIQSGECGELLAFLESLGVHEAWLSEVKPSSPAFWDETAVATEAERAALRELQDRYNRAGGTTVNYLGHFESGAHFGCNAGRKMLYVDAFGEVSPCVFTPVSFGNIRERPLARIWSEMAHSFRPSATCFINENWRRLRDHAGAQGRLTVAQTHAFMNDVSFGPMPRFYELFYRRHGRSAPGAA